MEINKNALKKVSLWCVSVLGAIYILFLVAPIIVNPILNSYGSSISDSIENSTGLKVNIIDLGIVTTPKLTVGVKVGQLDILLPKEEKFLALNNGSVKLSILPLLARKIELDSVSVKNIECNLGITDNGKFTLEEFFAQLPQSDTSVQSSPFALPFGIRLSNHLPNIKVDDYRVKFFSSADLREYALLGKDLFISDFIINKKVKFSTIGEVKFLDRKQFSYDIKLANSVMPNIDLNNILFPEVDDTPSNVDNSSDVSTSVVTSPSINVLDIFDALTKLHLAADLVTDLKISGSFDDMKFDGNFDINNMTMLVGKNLLPRSSFKMFFDDKNIDINSEFYTADSEKTTFSGIINSGKKPRIDLTCKSNLKFSSLVAILHNMLKAFGINDLATLSATGGLDADFNLKSNMKTVTSDGYLRIAENSPASIYYGLFNVGIDDIHADVDFSNDMFNLKSAGFSVAGQPLRAYGTIKNDSTTDLHVSATDILLKTLIAVAGQVQLLKENDINSGTISLNASLQGVLTKLIPSLEVNLANLDIYNSPSATSLKLPKVNLLLTSDGKLFNGVLDIIGLKINNPLAVLSLNDSKITIDEDSVSIPKTYLMFNNSKIDVEGAVTNYMSEKLAMNLSAFGSILASDIQKFIPDNLKKDMPAVGKMPISAILSGGLNNQQIKISLSANPQNYIRILDVDLLQDRDIIINSVMKISDDSLRFSESGIFADNLNNPVLLLNGSVDKLTSTQKLNLNLQLPKMLKFNIPGFKNSSVSAKGDINVVGTLLTPVLKGNIIVPSISIPDMLFSMENLVADVNGPILTGYGTLGKLQSGGIIAENLSADFGLKNYETFYLKNIEGDCFNGKINGNLSYGIMNAKTAVNIKGSGLDAEKAVAGAIGIKNALSGTLGFNANLKLLVLDYEEMMKSMTGSVDFDIQKGSFGNIGRFDSFVGAQNIKSNGILASAVASVVGSDTMKKTADFDSISGELSFNNAWADISTIDVQGPYTSYHLDGRYNLINGTTNVIILGRLSSDVVVLLGPLGDLSVDTLSAYIPKFGALTSSVLRAMTTNPAKENTDLIPPLTSDVSEYKDFKVEFNGGIESSSSVKSFKWLSVADTSAIDIITKDELKQSVTNVKNQLNETKEQLRETKNAIIDETKQQFKDAKEEFKNLFKF